MNHNFGLAAATGVPEQTKEQQRPAFKCRFSGCGASYRRKEHLRRHETQHTQQTTYICPFCHRGFGRSDTLRRHVRRHHNSTELYQTRAQQACKRCRAIKSRCEGGMPCHECSRRGILCSFDGQELDRISTARKNDNDDDKGPSSTSRLSPASAHTIGTQQASKLLLSETNSVKAQRCIELYFKLFHPVWPFLHKWSFDSLHETPLLVQSVVMIGLWASEEPTAQSAALELHHKLGGSILQQKEKWDASEIDDTCSSCDFPIPTYQAILLHIIFSLMQNNHGSVGLDLKLNLPPVYFDLLNSLVQSCKKLGLLHYPDILARFKGDEPPSYIWVSIEEIKHFNLALYKVCRMCHVPSTFRPTAMDPVADSGGEFVDCLLTLEDLKFPMPDSPRLWDCISTEDFNAAVAEEAGRMRPADACADTWISKCVMKLRWLI